MVLLHKRLVGGARPFWLLLALGLGLLLARLSLTMGAALVAGTALIILTLIQPLIGLGAALLLGPLGAWEALFLGPTPLDSGQLALLLTLTVWVARQLRDRAVLLPRVPLLLPLAGFGVVTALTLLDAPSTATGVRELLKWVEVGVLIWLVVDEAPRLNRQIGRPLAAALLLGVLLLAGASQGALGFWQFALRGDGPAHFLVPGGFYRAYGTFMQPNPFGGFVGLIGLLGLGTSLGLTVAWWQGRRDGASPTWLLPALLLAGLATAVSALGLIASWSRGAWLGFAAGLVVLLLCLPRKRRHGVELLLLAGAGIMLSLLTAGVLLNRLPETVVARVTSSFTDDLRLGDVRGVDITDANYAVLERLAHWQAAVGMAQDFPWLGIGFGNYEAAYARYRLINWPDALGHAHNYYLNLLAETGVVGLAAYLLLWTAVFWQAGTLLPQLGWRRRGIALGLLAAWTALSVHHLVDKLYVNNIYIHVGAMLGVQQLLWLETRAVSKTR